MTAEPIIELEKITKTFGEGTAAFQALKGVDLTIERGDFVAVMGPSGSGKSTTMNILGCLDVPTSGVFRFLGTEVQSLTRDQRSLLRRKYLGFVFQGFNLLARTTAVENVELPLLIQGESFEVSRERALDLLSKVGLRERASHFPRQLSGGESQRVAIARALIHRPQFILADEPSGNLDSRSGAELLAFMGRAVRELGQTIVMVTHDPVAAAYADVAVFLADGRIVDRIEDPSAESVLDRIKKFGE